MARVTPNMRLIDVNGLPHDLTEHQVRMMITIGWTTFLAAWIMNIFFYMTHPCSVDFSPNRFRGKLFIYIFGVKYNYNHNKIIQGEVIEDLKHYKLMAIISGILGKTDLEPVNENDLDIVERRALNVITTQEEDEMNQDQCYNPSSPSTHSVLTVSHSSPLSPIVNITDANLLI